MRPPSSHSKNNEERRLATKFNNYLFNSKRLNHSMRTQYELVYGEIKSHSKSHSKFYWTRKLAIETVKKEKYGSYQLLRKAHGGLWRFLETNPAIRSEIKTLLPDTRISKSHERAFKEMNECNSRGEFMNKYKTSYRFMLNNFKVELDKKLPGKRLGKWTLELCKIDAIRYATIKDWRENSIGAYKAARNNGWIENTTVHMKISRAKHGSLTLECCKKDALRFATKGEWAKYSPSIYSKVCLNKWNEECCRHMISGRNK